MQIVIDISKEIYDKVKTRGCCLNAGEIIPVEKAIANGITLPKGHGRLIEVTEQLYRDIKEYGGQDNYILDNAPTIVEADMRGDKDANSN